MKISNPMDYSNPNVKKINFELKRYVLSKIIDFCSERNISFNKYETHYLKVKGSTYNHLLKDNNYRLTNYVATRLLQPILTPLEITLILTEYARKEIELIPEIIKQERIN